MRSKSTLKCIALTLAAVGVFGVLAFSVNRRLREFGIRMALGARPADVHRLVMTAMSPST
jgi:ABC-type antimicrobial peptide transport system permease subunit